MIKLQNNTFTQKSSEINKALNVSRETFLVLEKFIDLLQKWNKKINLISRNSAHLVWQKHVLPSAELIKYIKRSHPIILDVGSGAGFPGIILSIIRGWRVILVEKNKKKCAFLNEAHSLTYANIVIENKTIEETNDLFPDIITSRGVTTIHNFLKLIDGFLNSEVQIMLIKGEKYQDEIDEALGEDWNFDYEIKHSPNKVGTIVILSNFKRA